MEKKNIDKKMKSVASIPTNYVSILQLQERWLKEKERKQKENDSVDRGVKQQQRKVDDEQRKREQGNRKEVVKATERKVNFEENRFRRNSGANRWRKEPNCGEKEVGEVSAIVSKKEEDGGKKNKRPKNRCESMEEAVKRESKVSPAYEDNPVKEEIQRVCKAKEENADSYSVAVETRFQNLWINKRVEEEGREVKGPTRLNSRQGYERNRRHDWSSELNQTRATTQTMVWVKKGNNGEAGGVNGV